MRINRSPAHLPVRRSRNTTRNFLLFVLVAALACLSTLVFSSSAQVSSRKSKAARTGRASTTRAKKPAKKKVSKNDRYGENEESEAEPGEADDPDGRANWFWFQREYPFGEIPAALRRRAWESLPQREKRTGLDSASMNLEVSTPGWSHIGPAPTTSAFPNNGGFTSGRINAIAVSPANTQIVLIGSATGGIWRSTNGGTTFSPVTDNQVDLAVGTIAFAPSNPNIVYAGMGDNDQGYFGTGVLKSTDAGATWTRVSNATLPDKGQCMKIQVDPANADRVYLAQYTSINVTTGGGVVSGIHLSTDGGVNWTRPFTGLVRDIVIHPTNPQILYAAVQFSFTAGITPGLYKSINGGTSWNQVFASPYTNTGTAQTATRDMRIAVTPANPGRVYIYFGTRNTTPFQVRLEMSDDEGMTWTSRGVISTNQLDPGQFGYNTYLYASPTNANTLYVGTRDLFRSTNGGVTFEDLTDSFAPPWPNGSYTPNVQKFHSDQQSFAFDPGNPNTLYLGSDGGIWKTTNASAASPTFTSLNASLSLTQFLSISVNPTDASRSYGGTQDNGTQLRVVGANSWREFSGGDGGQLVINPLSPSMVFTSYVRGQVSRFVNNGSTFTGQVSDSDTFGESLTDPRISFYPPIVGNGVDAKIYLGTWRLFVCSDCDNTSKSYNGANPPTWTAPGGTADLTTGGTDVLSAIAVARTNTSVIYTGSRAGRVMTSTNAGGIWTDITAGIPTRTITSLTVSPTNPSLVYLTVSGYGSGHIFRTTNGGTSWTNISNNLPNIPTSAFLIDPVTSTTLYAGTDIGVFQSTNSGTTWSAFNTNLPPVPVMAFTAQAGGLIQIGTYGRGAYEISSGASAPTPTPPNDNFANAQVISGCSGSVNGTNVGATKEAGEPNNPFSPTSTKSVWYQWLAPSTGNVTITTQGSQFDTVLAVYVGTSVASLDAAIASNDDIGGQPHNTNSSVTFAATAGTIYRIAVNGFDNQPSGGEVGSLVLNWNQSGCTPFQPVVLTSAEVELKHWIFQGKAYVYVKLLFPNAGYRVANWGQAVRTGNDFTADAAVEKFTGASVQALTTTAQIYDLGPLGNGTYNFIFKTSGTTAKTLQFTVSSTVPPANPIDDARQFVKQQYRDFLNREADQAGEDFWTDNITKCNDPARRPPGQTVEQCTLRQRETTSGAFFQSPEFQYTGYFVYRMYQGALGRQPKLSEFIPDAQFVGNGIIVGGQLSGAQINQNKAAFAATFVNCTDATKYRCSEFKAIYDALTNQQYVDKLFQTTGVNASASDRAALLNGLNGATETRATVLQKVVDGINVISEGNQQFTTTYGQAFYNAELNRAFVQLEYFGYMKRDPDEAGYAFWLGKLNQFGGDFVAAEMVLAFISSPEYLARFGQP